MPRARKGSAKRQAKNRVLKAAKGFWGGRSRQYRTAKPAVRRAQVYATRDRKARKREFRSLWIVRLNAAARARGVSYSKLIAALSKASIAIDRKMLSELAIADGAAFDRVLQVAGATA